MSLDWERVEPLLRKRSKEGLRIRFLIRSSGDGSGEEIDPSCVFADGVLIEIQAEAGGYRDRQHSIGIELPSALGDFVDEG